MAKKGSSPAGWGGLLPFLMVFVVTARHERGCRLSGAQSGGALYAPVCASLPSHLARAWCISAS